MTEQVDRQPSTTDRIRAVVDRIKTGGKLAAMRSEKLDGRGAVIAELDEKAQALVRAQRMVLEGEPGTRELKAGVANELEHLESATRRLA